VRLRGWPSRHATAPAALLGTGVLAAIARAPFLTAGLSPDEGGFAYIARQWGRGAVLYRDLWIDRPQGLLGVYRGILAIADRAWSVRLGALLIGVAIALLLGAIGWMLRSPGTGIAAAFVYAVVGAGPHIEGFTLNGELIAGLPSTAAVASAIVWWRTRRERWLFAAGVLGGSAILAKQSGFDGLVAAAALAVAAAAGPARSRLRSLAVVAAGAIVPIGAALLQAAVTVGLDRYWTEVVAFRSSGEFNDALGPRSELFEAGFPAARKDLLAVAAVAAIGLVAVLRRRGDRVPVVAWLVAALVALNVGGLYWPHYYMQVLPPLALLAGIGATAFRSRPATLALCAVAVAPVAVWFGQIQAPAASRHPNIRYEAAFKFDEKVADFVQRNTTPADTIYALDSRAELYFYADRRTTYPYIWHHSPALTPAGKALMRRMLAAPSRPKIVILYRNPRHVDPSGALSEILHYEYRVVWQPRFGVRVLEERPARLAARARVV
jgi:hypothetical protein